jgi:hypothetical protein
MTMKRPPRRRRFTRALGLTALTLVALARPALAEGDGRIVVAVAPMITSGPIERKDVEGLELVLAGALQGDRRLRTITRRPRSSPSSVSKPSASSWAARPTPRV